MGKTIHKNPPLLQVEIPIAKPQKQREVAQLPKIKVEVKLGTWIEG